MKAFAELFAALDETTRTTEKVEALATYFRAAPPADAAWAIYFLVGRKPRQVVSAGKLRAWAGEAAGLPTWLLDESYSAVGDSAEMVTLLLPDPGAGSELPLHNWIEERLLPLAKRDESGKKAAVLSAWAELDGPQRFLWNKLITGGFRVGVSKPTAIPNWRLSASACPKGPFSMAKSCPARRTTSCLLPTCRSASAAKSSAKNCSKRFPSSCWLTTFW